MSDPYTFEAFVILGALGFRARHVVIGRKPRTIQTNTNCLAAEPVQTVAFTSGYVPVTIDGVLEAYASTGETADEHLARLRHNLKTEVEKDANTLTLDWPNGEPETYRVFMNEDYATDLEFHVLGSHFVEFTVTLNCLP